MGKKTKVNHKAPASSCNQVDKFDKRNSAHNIEDQESLEYMGALIIRELSDSEAKACVLSGFNYSLTN